jgi:hypothetical protein
MKTILRFTLITPVFLMLFLAQGYAVQQTSPATAAAVQGAAPQDPALQAKIDELMAKGLDETKSLEERKAAYDQVLSLKRNDRDAILGRNQVIEKIKARDQQKATAESESKAKNARDEEFNSIYSDAMGAVRAQNLPRARTLLDRLRTLNPADDRVKELQRTFESVNSVARGKIIGLCIFIGGLLAGVIALIVRGMRPKRMAFKVMDGPDAGYVFPIEHPRVRVGSNSDHSDIALTDENRRISRVHFELYRSGNRYFVRDLSSNGTKVNDKQLTRGETAQLKPGDVISLADVASLEFFVAGKEVLQQVNAGGA